MSGIDTETQIVSMPLTRTHRGHIRWPVVAHRVEEAAAALARYASNLLPSVFGYTRSGHVGEQLLGVVADRRPDVVVIDAMPSAALDVADAGACGEGGGPPCPVHVARMPISRTGIFAASAPPPPDAITAVVRVTGPFRCTTVRGIISIPKDRRAAPRSGDPYRETCRVTRGSERAGPGRPARRPGAAARQSRFSSCPPKPLRMADRILLAY